MTSRFSLRWNNYASQLTDAFGSLLLEEDLVDVTLSCEGKKIKAHKMLLSACSPYFRDIFKENPCQHPVIVFRNVQYDDLKAIVEFIYCGEVNVLQEQLESFLQTAGILEVKGLTDKENESDVEKTSEMSMVDVSNMESEQEQQTNAIKEEVFRSPATSGCHSPPVKKRKESAEKLVVEPIDAATIIKEEVEEAKIDDNYIRPETPEPIALEDEPLGTRISFQGSDSETSKDIAHVPEKSPAKEEIECIDLEASVEDGRNSPETVAPDIKLVERKTAVPLKKRKNVPEKEVGDVTLEKKKCTPATKMPPVAAKGKVQIPKGLVVTSVKPASQVKDLFDFPQEPQVEDEAYTALRSEEATTPVHGEPILYSQEDLDTMVYEDIPHEHSEAEPEVAAEAPVLQEQTEPEEPVQEESKFDYFGCEICQAEAKPVDVERITYSHKCPICPCCCYCSHLLKEHMKVIHGWFNVQRRFTHY